MATEGDEEDYAIGVTKEEDEENLSSRSLQKKSSSLFATEEDKSSSKSLMKKKSSSKVATLNTEDDEEDADKAMAASEECKPSSSSSKRLLKKSSSRRSRSPAKSVAETLTKSRSRRASRSKSNEDLGDRTTKTKRKSSKKLEKEKSKKKSEKGLVKSSSKKANKKSFLQRYKWALLVLLFGLVAAFSFMLPAFLLDDSRSSSSSSLGSNAREVQFVEDLKYLSIGASRALDVYDWYSSYPYLLSPDHDKVTHLADGVSGPRYPSVCIQSLVREAGEVKALEKQHVEQMIDYYQPESEEEYQNVYDLEEEYDVIVLNYYIRALDGLYELTQRLRQRYPDAIIVLLKLWKPVHIGWYDRENGSRVGSLKAWSMHHGVEFDTEEFFEELATYPNLDLRWQGSRQRDEVVEHITQDFNVFLYTLPFYADEPKASIIEYRHFFSSDFTRISVEGHRVISLGILEIVYREFQSYPTEPRVGTWGEGDSCTSWFTTGRCTLEYSSNLVMEEFQGASAMVYALSTGLDRPNDSGWIIVENTFDSPRNLILSYMTDGPPPSMYPKTVVKIIPIDADGGREREEIDMNRIVTNAQVATNGRYGRWVHTVQTAMVGMIPPGKSRVFWKPLEEKERPFRLTAVEIVGGGVEIGGVLGPADDYTNRGQY